jgi:hypothetical protein
VRTTIGDRSFEVRRADNRLYTAGVAIAEIRAAYDALGPFTVRD